MSFFTKKKDVFKKVRMSKEEKENGGIKNEKQNKTVDEKRRRIYVN